MRGYMTSGNATPTPPGPPLQGGDVLSGVTNHIGFRVGGVNQVG